MSGQNEQAVAAWRLVAAREMAVRLRDKTFIGSTIFMIVLIVGSIGFSAFMAGRTSTVTVAVVGADAQRLVEAAAGSDAAGDSGLRLQARTAVDADEAERVLEEESADLALLPAGRGDERWEVVAQREIDGDALEVIATQVREAELAANARDAGTTADAVLEGTVVAERLLDAGALDPGLRFGLGFAFAFLFYGTALGFGLAIAQSVVEEKQSRVVEILAAAVPIRQLLIGKVVGNTLLAIGQVLLLSSVGLIGLSVSGQGEVLALVLGASLWFVVYFLLGFVALASVWAVCGSIATRQEDLQSTTMPVQAVVFVALFVGVSGTGTVLTAGSFVPIVSSVAMPVRMLGGDVPIWQPVASAVLVVAAAAALVAFGARSYERSLLRTNRRTSWREAVSRG